tara:strand:+ start:519 stop:872 length:354 start_codon:yes stop_codon:yes gene_type:complete
MIKGVEGRVRNILTEYPLTRDDDMKLYAMMIVDMYNFNKPFIQSQSADDLIKKIYNGNTPHFTSVLRCRQKLQETCPELRGKKYIERKKHAEKVKEELKRFEPDTGQGSMFEEYRNG